VVKDVPPTSIRVLPELRATQVEQSLLMTPAQTLYFRTNFDLEGTPIPESFLKVSTASAARFIARSNADVLELPEPLWIRFLPVSFALALSWRLSGLVRRRNRRARTYAIENNDPAIVLFGARNPPRLVKTLGLLAVGLIFRTMYEKVAYGTQGAANAYSRLPFARGVRSNVVPALPAAVVEAQADSPQSAVFVGRLEKRKGASGLIRCWPAIEMENPGAVLTIIGDGPLRSDVEAWASGGPDSRAFLGGIAHSAALVAVSNARILVAPSLRDGRWREQVGLPIVEGLSRGLTIVTSEDTGLSEWLRSNGHFVYSNSGGEDALRRALSDAIRAPIDRQAVLDSLPSRHGRLEADRWIHHD